MTGIVETQKLKTIAKPCLSFTHNLCINSDVTSIKNHRKIFFDGSVYQSVLKTDKMLKRLIFHFK